MARIGCSLAVPVAARQNTRDQGRTASPSTGRRRLRLNRAALRSEAYPCVLLLLIARTCKIPQLLLSCTLQHEQGVYDNTHRAMHISRRTILKASGLGALLG